MKGRTVMNTSRDSRLTRAVGGIGHGGESVPPWLRDQYSAVRANAAPRIEQARAAMAPVIADTAHRVRHDYVPAATQFSSRMASEAMERSAPLRAEVADRAAATLAAARGHLTPDQIEQLTRKAADRAQYHLQDVGAKAKDQAKATVKAAKAAKTKTAKSAKSAKKSTRGRRKFWFVGGAAALGAALGTAAVVWQRSHSQDWVEDDAVHNALDPDTLDAELVDDGSDNAGQMHVDDPSNPDGGATGTNNASDSPVGHRGKKH